MTSAVLNFGLGRKVVAAAFTAKSGIGTVLSYAGSPALAKQIEAGAPADIFISADLAWMDHVAAAGLIRPGTRSNLLGNSLVLVAPVDSQISIALVPGFDLTAALGDGKLAMADVKAVPAGKYGKESLENLGVWGSVAAKIAQTENVRAALTLVALGAAPLGIVYRSDATAEPRVKILDVFPEDSHQPILYPVAQLAGSTVPAAADFLAFLKSAAAGALFAQQGFKILTQ